MRSSLPFPRPFSRRQGRPLLALWLLIAALLPISLALAPRTALAQTKVFHNDRYDSGITVNSDGSLDVEERLVYVYDSGSFHRGNRNIDLTRVEDITNIQVSEEGAGGELIPYQETNYDPDSSTSGVPDTFGVADFGSLRKIRWVYQYTPDSPGFTKIFRVKYHAVGAVRVYSDHDEFDWYAVPQDWQGAINNSRVRVTFPAGIDTGALSANAITSIPAAEVSKQGNVITWSRNGNLDSGFEVGTKIPGNVMNATTPTWQSSVDQQEAFNAKTRPWINIAALLLSALIGIGGVLGVIRRWYTKGRDKPVKLFSDYITEPPSNLPPGLVGTLIDESADVRDVIATVVDQGRKGNLTIQEIENKGFLTSSKDFDYRQTASKVEYQYEQMVLDSLFSSGGEIKLSELKNTFYSKLPPIYDEMYKSLVALKYFPENPKSVRNRNFAAGVGLLVLGGLATFAGFGVGVIYGGAIPLIGIAIVIVGVAWLITAAAMPRKTDFGAEETAKWRAFGNYLAQMEKYTDVKAAADKFQQYLPYAVAMGLERQLIQQFNSVPAAMPPWYAPYGYSPFGYYPIGVGMPGQQGVDGGGGGPMPNLDPGAAMQGMSNSLGSAMQSMSDSFTTMVNSAASTLTSQPSSSGGGSGGGWGGGGGSFGGGGGGGGGGGAD